MDRPIRPSVSFQHYSLLSLLESSDTEEIPRNEEGKSSDDEIKHFISKGKIKETQSLRRSNKVRELIPRELASVSSSPVSPKAPGYAGVTRTSQHGQRGSDIKVTESQTPVVGAAVLCCIQRLQAVSLVARHIPTVYQQYNGCSPCPASRTANTAKCPASVHHVQPTQPRGLPAQSTRTAN